MVCYDFHHLNPAEKDFQIALKIRSWKQIVAEAKKCCMLCVICHRKFHAGFITLPDNLPMFDETLIQAQERPVQTRRTRADEKWDAANLAGLQATHGSAYAIAKHLNVNAGTIRTQLRKRGLIK